MSRLLLMEGFLTTGLVYSSSSGGGESTKSASDQAQANKVEPSSPHVSNAPVYIPPLNCSVSHTTFI